MQEPSEPRADDLEVIVPNLNWRYSGVTAANRGVAPRIARTMRMAWFGSYAPEGVARLSLAGLLRLRARSTPVVWHARRNVEMALGLLLKFLGWPFKLIFTSAAQRQHTATTRWMIARMDAVIATSAASASFLRRKASIIHHGVDPELYRPADNREAAWAQSGLPGRYGIGCFGRIRHQKGTDIFVTAMCNLLPRYPDFTAVIIGETTGSHDAFADRLKEQIAAAGLADRIKFLGALPIEELPRWFSRISIYAFTSRNEGFGLTLLEAMAAGNALVAARAGAAEIVVADGENGYLVPPGDAEATAVALEKLIGDTAKRNEFGRRARERVVADFSLDAEAAKIAALYRAVQDGALAQ